MPTVWPDASDMLEDVSPRYHFCLGAAGYPEGHIKAENQEKDLEYLKLKVDKGAEYSLRIIFTTTVIISILSTTVAAGVQGPHCCRHHADFSSQDDGPFGQTSAGPPSAASYVKAWQPCRRTISQRCSTSGIDFAFEQCKELIGAGVPGLHFYTMDRSKSTAGVVVVRQEGLI